MRKYSNNKINFAGEILKTSLISSEHELRLAQDILTYWRTIHGPLINTFQVTLRNKLKRLNISDYLIAQRLKRAESIITKLNRIDNMQLSRMQDIAGIRAVLRNLKEVRSIENNYRKHSKFSHELVGSKDYINEPANSGYRGIHLVYRYNSEYYPESNNLRIELQIRTKLQHTWATAVETMGTFLNYSLKASQGPKKWLDFFSLVSSGFSYLEKSKQVPGYEMLSEEDTFNNIIKQFKKLEVEKHFRGFTVAADHITHNVKNSKYNLIILNLEKRRVQIKNYSEKNLEIANKEYTDIERKIVKGEPLQVVLVSTGSIESLRRAYPNYFLDTNEFLKKIEFIEKLYIKKIT